MKILPAEAEELLANWGQRRGVVPEHIADMLPDKWVLRRAEQTGPMGERIGAMSTLTDAGFDEACRRAEVRRAR